MTVHDYPAPWMRRPGANVPTNPVQTGPARTSAGREAAARYLLVNDPSCCCEACEELTAMIGALGDGPELDAAVSAHGCRRGGPMTSPARQATRHDLAPLTRGTCRVCRKDCKLTKDDLVWGHHGRNVNRCPGSGRAPVESQRRWRERALVAEAALKRVQCLTIYPSSVGAVVRAADLDTALDGVYGW